MKLKSVIPALLLLALPSAAFALPITYPGSPATDTTGAAVTSGVTATVASVTDLDGTAKSSTLAAAHVAGGNTSAVYDAAANGEAWVTLNLAATGHTFVPIVIFCSADPSTLASTNANTVNLGTGQGVITTQTSSAARVADMVAALTSQGYTVTRAVKIDGIGGPVASVTAPVSLPTTAPTGYGFAGLTTTDINAVRDAIFSFPVFADSTLTFRAATGDTWAVAAGPSTATYPDATHQNTVYQTPAGAGQHSTGLTTNTAGKPVSRTVTHP